MTDRPATMARQDQARELHDQGYTWDQVAAMCTPPYARRSSAYEAALAASRRDPDRRRHERIAAEEELLEWLIVEGTKLYRRHHFVVAPKGDVVLHPETGEPLDDDGCKLEALKFIKGVGESRRKLRGLDAPTRSRVEVITEDMVEAEIRRITEEMGVRDSVTE